MSAAPCARCGEPSTATVMGPYAGDWSERVCDACTPAAQNAYGGPSCAITYRDPR